MIQHHPAQHAAANYYHHHQQQPQHYMAPQPRLPIHSTSVHAPVQVQGPVHQTPGGGHVQQTTQHNHQLPHVPQQQQQQQQQQAQQQQQPPNSGQMVSRTEGSAATSEWKRERKILKIVDPNTGK